MCDRATKTITASSSLLFTISSLLWGQQQDIDFDKARQLFSIVGMQGVPPYISPSYDAIHNAPHVPNH